MFDIHALKNYNIFLLYSMFKDGFRLYSQHVGRDAAHHALQGFGADEEI
jgi:hypothetical protein